VSLPPLQEQRRIAAGLDQAGAAADQLHANALRAIGLVKELRLAYLVKALGSMRSVHERFDARPNPIPGLGGLISLRAGGEAADFYIQRSGTPENVGRPFREAFQEPGTRRRGPGDPRHHIGVTVVRRDVLDPRFLFYVAEYAWRSGIYRRLCHGTLALQHLRLRDVACGLSAAIGPRSNPDVLERGRHRRALSTGDPRDRVRVLVDLLRRKKLTVNRVCAAALAGDEASAALVLTNSLKPSTKALERMGYDLDLFRDVLQDSDSYYERLIFPEDVVSTLGLATRRKAQLKILILGLHLGLAKRTRPAFGRSEQKYPEAADRVLGLVEKVLRQGKPRASDKREADGLSMLVHDLLETARGNYFSAKTWRTEARWRWIADYLDAMEDLTVCVEAWANWGVFASHASYAFNQLTSADLPGEGMERERRWLSRQVARILLDPEIQ
jgi:hypothetical protein